MDSDTQPPPDVGSYRARIELAEHTPNHVTVHEIGHLLGADHSTLTRHPTACVSHGSAVQAAYQAGKGDGR